MRDTEENRAIEAIRAYFDAPSSQPRAVTAEWLAGRLGLPLHLCEGALGRLVSARVVSRVRRPKTTPIYVRRMAWRPGVGVNLVLALIVLAVVTAAVLIALNARYLILGAEALAIGLIVAFAWLDAELRDHPPADPPPGSQGSAPPPPPPAPTMRT